MTTAPKEKQILFSSDMIRAILGGRKTKTRRIAKNIPVYDEDTEESNCPYEIGQKLWVRETWQWEGETSYKDASPIGQWWRKADEGILWEIGPAKWKPAIFMPKQACRIFLKVKNIQFERLHDITEKDAISEGIEFILSTNLSVLNYKDYSNGQYPEGFTPIKSFQSLWTSIHGKDSWEINPWVWVIEFEPISI